MANILYRNDMRTEKDVYIVKELHEGFAKFFENPTREGLRDLLMANFGEQNNLDFKADWSSFSKMAKHILAFANSGEGCIVLGVSQKEDGSLESVGLNHFIDKATVKNNLDLYLPNTVDYHLIDYTYDSSEYKNIIGKKFQVFFIEDAIEYIPFVSMADGDGIRKNAIYVRRGTSSEEASYEELQKIINRRIETGYSTSSELQLEEHLSQLKILYSNINRSKFVNCGSLIVSALSTENPNYPNEDFECFIVRMIKAKKERIEKALDV